MFPGRISSGARCLGAGAVIRSFRRCGIEWLGDLGQRSWVASRRPGSRGAHHGCSGRQSEMTGLWDRAWSRRRLSVGTRSRAKHSRPRSLPREGLDRAGPDRANSGPPATGAAPLRRERAMRGRRDGQASLRLAVGRRPCGTGGAFGSTRPAHSGVRERGRCRQGSGASAQALAPSMAGQAGRSGRPGPHIHVRAFAGTRTRGSRACRLTPLPVRGRFRRDRRRAASGRRGGCGARWCR